MRKAALPAMIMLLALSSTNLFACAVCYGKSDAPMAHGMNAGIMVLLGVIAVVLSGVAGFFFYLAKKPALPLELPSSGTISQSTEGN